LDDGAGVVSTFVGAAIFIVFLLFSAQLLLGLYLSSVVSAVTYDAARTAAGASSPGQGAVESSARRQLGAFGADAVFVWSGDADALRLTVRVRRPPVLPGLLPAGRSPIVRTARVRLERVR
jgi:hypothetical protein